ncbi:MAG TPA: TolC family protein, partial [Pseudomonadota bacterium]|nr:TolC family protein [Pseudomonadota bacterium]
ARGAAAQAEATAVRATVEVTQALVRYRATVERLRLYTQGVLTDAEQVHKAMLYSYQRGSASLLEVLAAQRTVDEVNLSYADALAEHARGLIALERAAGIWDLDF